MQPLSTKQRLSVLLVFAASFAHPFCNGWYLPWLGRHRTMFWTVDVAANAVLPLAIYLLGRRLRLFTNADLGFHTRVFGIGNPLLFMLVIAAFGGAILLLDPPMLVFANRFQSWWPDHVDFSYREMLPVGGRSTGLLRLIALAYFAVTAGFTEEMCFRGLLRLVFGRGWFGTALFVVISSALFASVHWEQGAAGIIFTALWGLATAITYAATGNLWPCVVIHALADFEYLK